jgi:hypothetical protein
MPGWSQRSDAIMALRHSNEETMEMIKSLSAYRAMVGRLEIDCLQPSDDHR